jgi:hypothetical protein
VERDLRKSIVDGADEPSKKSNASNPALNFPLYNKKTFLKGVY